jgi:N-acetylglucosamine kinase-like BadF-type ATPase
MTTNPQPPFVLGLDAGGTKTVCYLADGNGTIISEGRTGGANLQAAGELEVEKSLHTAMEQAIGGRDIAPSAICVGIAGVDRPADARVVGDIMRRIGYKARVVVANDALVALVAGAGHGPGVVVVAGTGSIAYGRDETNRAARAGGWGYVLGDEGSGYWIGRLALRAVVRESDGRGPATALTPAILAHFRVSRPQDLVHEIYDRTIRPASIAAVARHVQHACERGDPIAAGIISSAAGELLACAQSVVRQLAMKEQPFTFVLSGGIFHAVPLLASRVVEGISGMATRATIVHLDREPAWGAVQIALSEARGESRVPVYLS